MPEDTQLFDEHITGLVQQYGRRVVYTAAAIDVLVAMLARGESAREPTLLALKSLELANGDISSEILAVQVEVRNFIKAERAGRGALDALLNERSRDEN